MDNAGIVYRAKVGFWFPTLPLLILAAIATEHIYTAVSGGFWNVYAMAVYAASIIFILAFCRMRYELFDDCLEIYTGIPFWRMRYPYSEIMSVEKLDGLISIFKHPLALNCATHLNMVKVCSRGRMTVLLSPADRDGFMEKLNGLMGKSGRLE